jgi:hypothetical protein
MFNQANYATMNGIAQAQQQIGAQNAQLQAAQSAQSSQAAIGIGTTAATIAANAAGACWVARVIYPDNRWKVFRHWLVNKAPKIIRRMYLRYGEAFSQELKSELLLQWVIKLLMDRVIESTVYVNYSW